jgi:hypothetical protein
MKSSSFVCRVCLTAMFFVVTGTTKSPAQNPSASKEATPAASAAPSAESAPIIPPREGRSETETLFNGTSLSGFDGNPDWWTMKDGAISAKSTDKVPTNFLIGRKNYSDFRLTLWSKVVESDNHAGVAFWGTPAVQESTTGGPTNYWAYKGLLVIFPGLGMWDYTTTPGRGVKTDPALKELAKQVAGQNDWIQVEILVQGNRVRAAYNGVQVIDYREPEPDRRRDGPIALQLHGYSKPQEVLYKDVVIETFPKEDRLLTLKPKP